MSNQSEIKFEAQAEGEAKDDEEKEESVAGQPKKLQRSAGVKSNKTHIRGIP